MSKRGGHREGAGRKPRGAVTVTHAKRPKVDPDHPLLITKHVVDDVQLDDADTWALIQKAAREATELTSGFEVQRLTREGLAVLLLVSAKNRKALTRGMQGLSIRIARRLNRLRARSGRVFAERYEAEALDTKKAVERALARF